MNTIHLISHTHWDREWYLTFQQFRLKLVHLIDHLLDILENDPNYKYFLLDGQTIILEDYLQIRPEREAALANYIREGRILIGPWYISPDEFLVAPESHIRNLLEGKRLCEKYGNRMEIGYLPDTFGHIGQMPQILQGFGIDAACMWRGLADQPLELEWRSPDGTSVLLSFLRESYGNAANLSLDNSTRFIDEINERSRTLAPFTMTGQILLMDGTDHAEPVEKLTPALLAYNNNIQSDVLLHSSFPIYFDAVRSQIAARGITLPVITGELRSSMRSPLLPNVLSTRIWIKQRNYECENELIKWVEPFNAWASLLDRPSISQPQFSHTDNNHVLVDQQSAIRYAWKLLMQCHPHDSICGTSIDQVHGEMRSRFDQVEQVAQELLTQNIQRICNQINTSFLSSMDKERPIQDILSSIVVFNPNDQPQSGLANLQFTLGDHFSSFEIIDEQSNKIPYHQTGTGPKELISLTLDKKGMKQGLGMIQDGKFAGMVIRTFEIKTEGDKAFIQATISNDAIVDHDKWSQGLAALDVIFANNNIKEFIIHAYSDPEVELSFIARDVPGHGYRNYWICGIDSGIIKTRKPLKYPVLFKVFMPLVKLIGSIPAFPPLLKEGQTVLESRPPQIENEFFVVDATGSDGSISVIDKRTHQVYSGLNLFVDGADCGDLYNYCPPQHDHLAYPKMVAFHREENATRRSLIIKVEMSLPKSLSTDRKSRSRRKVKTQLVSTITLIPGVPRVDIHTELDNQSRDHRLRVHFPSPFISSTATFDGSFELVERPIGVPDYDSSWVELPRPEVPQKQFTMVSGGIHSLVVANRGLPEVEVMKNSSGHAEIAITLLRCVGWLSRDDLTTRKGHAGPMIATPDAQMLGRHAFDYSIIPSGRNSNDAIHQAVAFNAPLRAYNATVHNGSIPPKLSILNNTNPNFMITGIKLAEDTNSLIVRGYNLLSDAIEIKIKPYRSFNQVYLANLAENDTKRLPINSDGSIDLHVRGNKIITLRFHD